MYTVKKIVSVLMIIAAAAAIGGGVVYSLSSFGFGLVDFDGNMILNFSKIAVIGGFATLGLGIISIVLSCIAVAKRPHAAVGIAGVLTGAVAFLMIPFTSFGSTISFAFKFPSLASSDFYQEGSKYFGLGMVVFALISMILAISDLVKTNRGE